MFWRLGVIITLICGISAFGSNYDWAHTPLIIASALLGVAGCLLNASNRNWPWALSAALAVVPCAAAVQLIPLSRSALSIVSPNVDAILRQYDFTYASGALRHALSIDPQRTALFMAFQIAFSLLLLGTVRMMNRRTQGVLSGAITVVGTVVAIEAMIQNATAEDKIFGFWTPYMSDQPFGPFVNRNHFAGLMLMCMPVSWGYAAAQISRFRRLAETKPWRRLVAEETSELNQAALAGFAAFTMMLAILLSLSRSGIFAMFVAIGLFGYIARRSQGTTPKRVAILLLVAGLSLSALVWAGTGRIMGRFAELIDGADRTGRIAIWSKTLRILQDYPLTGTGMNTFGVAMIFYQSTRSDLHFAEAHNDYLQLAAEGGALVGVPALVAASFLVRRAVKALRLDAGSTFWIRTGILTAIGAIGIQEIVEFSLQMPGNAVLFTVLIGLAVSGVYESGPHQRLAKQMQLRIAATANAGRTERDDTPSISRGPL